MAVKKIEKGGFSSAAKRSAWKIPKKPAGSFWLGLAFFVMFVVGSSYLVWLIVGGESLGAFFSDRRNLVPLLIIYILAGIFPHSALAYNFFQRDKQLKELEWDFRLLGVVDKSPSTLRDGLTVSKETEKRYDVSYGPGNFAFQATLVALVTILGLSLFFWPPHTGPIHPRLDRLVGWQMALFDDNTLQAMRYGFLGAYLFSLHLVYRRYTTLDLQPTVYMYCAFTIIAGLVLNYVAFTAIGQLQTIQQPLTGAGASIVAIIAFSLGYFPYLAIRWFNRVGYTALGIKQHRDVALPLGLIDGVSQIHETRLRDEGIDNIQNLATAPILDLIVNTPFGSQEVIEWVDQAALYLYLEQNEIESFRRGGVRTVSDFQAYWYPYYPKFSRHNHQDSAENVLLSGTLKDEREKSALQLQSTPARLDILYRTLADGPNMGYIESYWKISKKIVQDQQYRTAQEQCQEFERHRKHRVAVMRQRELVRERLDHLEDELERVTRLKPPQIQKYQDTLQAYLEVIDKYVIATYPETIEQYPNDANLYNDLAWFYAVVLERNFDEALRLAEEAIELAAEQGLKVAIPSYLDTLATVKIRLAEQQDDLEKKRKLLNEAEAHLEEADSVPESERWPSNPPAVAEHLREIERLRESLG